MGDGISWRRCVMLIICSHGRLLICIELWSFLKNLKNTWVIISHRIHEEIAAFQEKSQGLLGLCCVWHKKIHPNLDSIFRTICSHRMWSILNFGNEMHSVFQFSIPVFISFLFFFFYLGVYTRSWYLAISVSLHPWQRSCSILVTKFAHCKRCEMMVVLKHTTNLNPTEEVATFNLHQLSDIY